MDRSDALTVSPTEERAAPPAGLPNNDAPSLGVPGWWLYLASTLLALLVFGVDIMLPRGAAPAIGHCAAVVLAGESRRSWFVLTLTGICSVLTWAGYLLEHYVEPSGSPLWMSALNRGLVMAVIWLTAGLALLRQKTLAQLELTTQELARSNQELEHFAATVSHDLRSPLVSIGGCAQLLEEQSRDKLDEDSLELIRHIQESVRRMGDMTERLLHYARVGSGGLVLRICDLNQVVDQVIRDLKSTIQANNARISRDPLPQVWADERLLAQVFQNLIENAIKYRGADPPVIHVRARSEPSAWVVSIRDNGAGIRAQDVDRIFAPFERGRQNEFAVLGSGLGLATCRKIIELHGGNIWVESRVGSGSTFHFRLPRRPSVPPRGGGGEHQVEASVGTS